MTKQNSKPKLLIINKEPFGELIDSLKWCEYLRSSYKINFICFDSSLSRTHMEGVGISYISSIGPRFFRGLRYILYCIFSLLFFRGKILVVYFPGCSIFKYCFPFKEMILDIRTLSTYLDKSKRKKADAELKKTIKLYNKVSIISLSLLDKLGVKQTTKFYELPLGADLISTVNKSYDEFNLLYVGGLYGRDIHKTLYGLKTFIDNHPHFSINYTIIGKNRFDETNDLKNLCKKLGIEKYVNIYTQMPHRDLEPFFKKANIGVSFIPMTEYYNLQPPTKTFEYVLSGMICLATATEANKEFVNSMNGILHIDSQEGFNGALEEAYEKRKLFNTQKIQNTLIEYSWSHIVNTILKKILDD